MKLTEDQLELLRSFASSDASRLAVGMLDDIVNTIKGNLLSVPLDKDPEKAALVLYAERMKLEGAVAIRNAFTAKVEELRSKR